MPVVREHAAWGVGVGEARQHRVNRKGSTLRRLWRRVRRGCPGRRVRRGCPEHSEHRRPTDGRRVPDAWRPEVSFGSVRSAITGGLGRPSTQGLSSPRHHPTEQGLGRRHRTWPSTGREAARARRPLRRRSRRIRRCRRSRDARRRVHLGAGRHERADRRSGSFDRRPDRVLGEEGQGPREFRSIRGIWAADGGEIGVVDVGNRRVSFWSSDGEFRWAEPLDLLPGAVVSWGSTAYLKAGAMRGQGLGFYEIASDGSVAETPVAAAPGIAGSSRRLRATRMTGRTGGRSRTGRTCRRTCRRRSRRRWLG